MCIQTLKSTAGRACHPFRKLQKTWCPEEAAILLSIRRPHPLPSQGPRTVSHAHIYSNHHGLEMFTPSSFNLYQGSPQGSSQHVSCLSPKRGSLCLLKCYSSLKVCLMLLTLWILLWHILWMWVSFFLKILFIWQRKTQWEGTQAGGVGEREAGFLPRREPSAGLHPRTPGSWPELKADA